MQFLWLFTFVKTFWLLRWPISNLPTGSWKFWRYLELKFVVGSPSAYTRCPVWSEYVIHASEVRSQAYRWSSQLLWCRLLSMLYEKSLARPYITPVNCWQYITEFLGFEIPLGHVWTPLFGYFIIRTARVSANVKWNINWFAISKHNIQSMFSFIWDFIILRWRVYQIKTIDTHTFMECILWV